MTMCLQHDLAYSGHLQSILLLNQLDQMEDIPVLDEGNKLAGCLTVQGLHSPHRLVATVIRTKAKDSMTSI